MHTFLFFFPVMVLLQYRIMTKQDDHDPNNDKVSSTHSQSECKRVVVKSKLTLHCCSFDRSTSDVATHHITASPPLPFLRHSNRLSSPNDQHIILQYTSRLNFYPMTWQCRSILPSQPHHAKRKESNRPSMNHYLTFKQAPNQLLYSFPKTDVSPPPHFSTYCYFQTDLHSCRHLPSFTT